MGFTPSSTYICDKCGTQRQWYRHTPSVPDGWVMLGDLMYCDNHTLNLTVDGEVVERKAKPIVAPPTWETD